MTKELTEHEQLKELCDIIEYTVNDDLYFWDNIKNHFRDNYGDCRYIDSREIIFTKGFSEAYKDYHKKQLQELNYSSQEIYDNYYQLIKVLMLNLDNPVTYLFNRIKGLKITLKQ